MKEINLLEENLKNFSFILSNFLKNENLTIENYNLVYRYLVKHLKQNFRQLKLILLDNSVLEENLNFMEVQTKRKKKEYWQDVCDTLLIFEKTHYKVILDYLKQKKKYSLERCILCFLAACTTPFIFIFTRKKDYEEGKCFLEKKKMKIKEFDKNFFVFVFCVVCLCCLFVICIFIF